MTRRLTAVVFSLGLALLAAGQTLAQSEPGGVPAAEPESRIEALQQQLEKDEPVIQPPTRLADEAEPGTGDLLPTVIDPNVLDESGQRAMRLALQGYYDYRIRGFQHRSRVFEWQLLSSKVIFVLVIGIVAAGLYFSWLQFMAGLRGTPGMIGESTLEASPTAGLKVSSPILGVVILALSLVFFYLYLVHVYPIEEIF